MKISKYIAVFVVHFLFCGFCFAQKERIDSLKKVLPALKDSARIVCLNAISEVYAYYEKDSAEMYAQAALKDAEKLNFKIGIADAWLNLAWTNWLSVRDLIVIENYCRKAIMLLEKSGEKKLLAVSWHFLGIALNSQCKFSAAIDAYSRAGRLFWQTEGEMGLANMYAYMADVERNRGQYKKSLDYSVKWLDIANKHKDKRYIDVWAALYSIVGDHETALDYYSQAAAIAKMNQQLGELVYFTMTKGEIFLLLEKYDSARHYYDLAIQYMPQQPPLNSLWGAFYLAQKKYDSALFHLTSALTYSKKNNVLIGMSPILLNLSRVHKETGNIQLALRYARELLQAGEETQARQHIRDGHLMLYQLFAQSGNKDSSFSHLQKYTVLKDTIDKDLSAQKLAFYKIRAEKEKDQARIDLLNEEKKLQQQELKQTAQQRKILIGGIAGIFLLGIFLLRNIILKRKNESHRREIAENELQLQKLESEKTKVELQQQTTELEMQALRAQMNPHFIFNSLNSINRFILQNNKAQASGYLTKFSKLIRLILQNSQSTLIPLESELESLQLYLELEAVRFDHHFEFRIKVDDELDIDIIKVPPLIIQPYAENAIWHGLMNKEDKGHLEIELFQEQDMLYCKITDDGIGRKQAAVIASKKDTRHKSMGLKITADRISMLQRLNGNESPVTINDLVNADGTAAGTEVIIKIPVVQ